MKIQNKANPLPLRWIRNLDPGCIKGCRSLIPSSLCAKIIALIFTSVVYKGEGIDTRLEKVKKAMPKTCAGVGMTKNV